MADTINALNIPGTWTDLNTLSGISVGTGIILQNLGSTSGAVQNIGTPNVVIEITTSSTTPDESFIGWHMLINEQFTVDTGDPKVWLKFTKLGGADVGSETALVKVQAL